MAVARKLLSGWAIVGLVLAAHAAPATQTERDANILVLVLDDVGVDKVGAYRAHPSPPPTPRLDALASDGVLFERAWAHPSCSPSRAGLLTGRHAFRHGIGSAIPFLSTNAVALPLDEVTIPEVLRRHTALFGKWHLGTADLAFTHPIVSGFDVYAGTPAQVNTLPLSFGNPSNYQQWKKVVDGELVTTTVYATTDTANDTIAAITHPVSEPWFVVASFNAAHKPLHVPPAHLHTQGTPSTPLGKYDAMVEALDTEIGRVLRHVDTRDTYVIALGDNGTIAEGSTAPFSPDHAKTTPYEGGLRVPLIVAGPGVARGRRCRALVQVQDLFPTILELAGEVAPPSDGVSFVAHLRDPELPSARRWVFSEAFAPNGVSGSKAEHVRAVRDGRFKIVAREPSGLVEFYDLLHDPFEHDDLADGPLDVEQQAHFDALMSVVEDFVAQTAR